MRLQGLAQRIGADIPTSDEALSSGCNVGDDDSGAPCGTLGVQRFEDVEAHDDLTAKISSGHL
jgi:hypothetical protein